MSIPIIEVQNLSKFYYLGTVGATTLRESFERWRLGTRGKERQSPSNTLWALKDVSFSVGQGEIIGIIGRNGAGKSTLLKILSKITEPTSGRATLRGRVASLLEVGTGFHPELTGRENVYLNGAILGMRRAETDKKFDEIVAFAGIEKFVDTPVKHYSSGMYVRLAFAVAAHLEPEILLVDEVLAVGDAEFQKKCLGKMCEVAKSGKTVLFISHNMAALQKLCPQSLLLREGRLVMQGTTDTAIEKYLKESDELSQRSLADRKDRQGTAEALFISYSLRDRLGRKVQSFRSGEDAEVVFQLKKSSSVQCLSNLNVSVGIDDPIGQRLCLISNVVQNGMPSSLSDDTATIIFRIKELPLHAGRYSFTIFCVANDAIADWVQNAGFFDVETKDFYGTGKLPPMTGQGYFLLRYDFKIQPGNLESFMK